MTARILVVDDSVASIKLLQAKLTSEYLEVVTAKDGPDALCKVLECHPDIVLLDVVMPGMDGFEVCRRIKSAPETTHVPVVMVTTLAEPAERVAALNAGADDFLTKPLDPLDFIARVRSLIRYKAMIDELRERERTGRDLGLSDAAEETVLGVNLDDCQILLIEDQRKAADSIRLALSAHYRVHVEKDSEDAILLAKRADLDLIIVSLSLTHADGLRQCARLRAMEETRRTPLLAIVKHGDSQPLVRALEIGVNGFVTLPADPDELIARVQGQMRAKRYGDHLRQNARRSLEKAIRDPLTGMHNRRYLETHLGALVAQNVQRNRPVSLLIVDVDHFKKVNDTYGHDVGDEVLREVAQRVSSSLRGLELACRFGGEEFVAAFSGVDVARAREIGERLREKIAGQPFPIDTGKGLLEVTVSIGLATTSGPDDTADALLKRADLALYRAKQEGRNRVADAA